MNNDKFETLEYEDDDWVSRSELKREAEAFQELGVKLSQLKPGQLEKVEIRDQLRDALDEIKRLKPRSNALKRHFQYIGKLMRYENAEAIQHSLNSFDETHEEYNKKFHRLEKWRDRLINNEQGMMDVILNEYPQTDIQHLRQLVRNTQREIAAGKKPISSKKLFKYLRELEDC
ncbi:MAG: ribosome biogenesis factor YjgA [Pseudomonadales bacterium]